MKHRIAKTCSLLPFGIYGLLIMYIICMFLLAPEDLCFTSWLDIFYYLVLFGWIPPLVSSVLGIVFSALSLKEKNAGYFFVISIVACFLSFCWGLFIIKTFWNGLQD